MLTLAFALGGGYGLMFLLGYNMSIASAAGFIALRGLTAEFGLIMLLYLKQALEKHSALGDALHIEAADACNRRGCRAPGHGEGDDGGSYHRRPAADHVGLRKQFRSDETHCRPDGGWHDYRSASVHVRDFRSLSADPQAAGFTRKGSRGCETICHTMEAAFTQADYEGGVASGIQAVRAHLAAHFPAVGDNRNQMSNSPTVL